jgi:uncharacterized protein (DUF1697 family)
MLFCIMASVVFFRAANVGGHQVFKPSALAKELADLKVVNVGAAGTFVVFKPIEPEKLGGRIVQHLAFKPQLIICSAEELLTLESNHPFSGVGKDPRARPYVTIFEDRPSAVPRLPLEQPVGRKWEVRVLAVRGRFALSLCRRLGKGITYPNPVCEKHFGMAATTRNWDTIQTICKLLKEQVGSQG